MRCGVHAAIGVPFAVSRRMDIAAWVIAALVIAAVVAFTLKRTRRLRE
jgi:hypothetical protein